MVRFLSLLDEEVREISKNWSGVDFNSSTFDIGSDYTLIGVAYDLYDDKRYLVEGNLTGTIFSAIAADGSFITAEFDETTGSIANGVWTNKDKGTSGNFDDSSCTLNKITQRRR